MTSRPEPAAPASLPIALPLPDGSSVVMRAARRGDVAAIVVMFADDPLGRHREGDHDDPAPYLQAFDRITASPANLLVVAVDESDSPIGTFQLTVIPGLGRRGTTRLLIEAVHVDSRLRGKGIGAAMMRWAIQYARDNDCGLVQLTSHKTRTDAHRFYLRLGFEKSHEGMKLIF